MSRGSRSTHWSNSSGWRDDRFIWQVKDTASTVTTRSGLSTGDPFPFGSESEEEWNSSGREDPKSSSETESETGEAEKVVMANIIDPDPEIGSLTAHLDGEPAQAIVMNLLIMLILKLYSEIPGLASPPDVDTHCIEAGRSAPVGAHLEEESCRAAVSFECALVGIPERGGSYRRRRSGADVVVVGLEIPDDDDESEAQQCCEEGLGLEVEDDLGGAEGRRSSVLLH